MALNNYGLGFEFSGKDKASSVAIGLGKQIGLLEEGVNDLNEAFEETTNRTRDLSTGRFVKAPQGLLNKDFLGKVGVALTGIGIAATGFGYGIAQVMREAAGASLAFETSVNKVATIADKAEFPLSKIRDIGFEMGQTYGGDLNTQVDALYSAIGSGAEKAADAVALLHASNKLAIGGLTTVDVAMNGLMGTLNAYGIAYGKATEVTDAFFQAVKLGGSDMSVQTLANGLGNVTPIAAAMGVSLDELTGSIAALTAAGQKTDIAITNIKGAMEVFLKPNKDAADEAKRLGIEFNAAALKSKGLLGMIKEITGNAKFNADSLNKLFGQSSTAMGAMLSLAKEDGAVFNKFMEEMAKKTGAADQAFQTLSQTGEFLNSVLKTNIQAALVRMGDIVAPIIGKIMFIFNKLVLAFNKAGPTFQKIVTYGLLIAGALGFLIGWIASSTVAIAGLIAMGKVLLIALGVVAAALVAVAAAAAPVILAATAIYVAWTKNIGGFQQTVIVWFNKIKLAFQAIVQLFSDGGFSGEVLSELENGNQGIEQFAINIFLWFNRIKNFAKGVWEGFSLGMERLSPIIEKITSAFQRLIGRFAPVKEAASSAKETFDSFGGAGKKTGDFLVTIVEKVATGFLGLINFIDGAIETFKGFKQPLLAAWDAVKALFGAFGTLFSVLGGGNSGAQTTADTWRTIGNVLGWVANVGIYLLIAQFRVLGGIITWVSGIIEAVRVFFDGFVQNIVLGVKLIGAIFSGEWGKAWDLAQKMVENWAQTIIGMLMKVVAGAAGMADSLGKIFGQDLGLKAKVEGFGKDIGVRSAQPAPAATPAPATSQSQVTLPAAAQATALQPLGAAPAPAPAPAPKLPDVNLKSQVVLDNRVLGEANQKAKLENDARSFFPTPSPTG